MSSECSVQQNFVWSMLHYVSQLTATLCVRSLTKMQMEAIDFRQQCPKDMLVKFTNARIQAARQHDEYCAVERESLKVVQDLFIHYVTTMHMT